MTFPLLLQSLVRGWYIVLLSALLGVGAAFVLTRGAEPAYTATAKVLISPASDAAGGTLATIIPTYAQLATTSAVLDPVAQSLHLPGGTTELATKVKANSVSITTIIDVNADDPDPARAAQISQAVAERLSTFLNTSPMTKSQVRTQIVEDAAPPTAPSSAPRTKLLATGLVLGLGLGLGLAIVVGAVRTMSSRRRANA